MKREVIKKINVLKMCLLYLLYLNALVINNEADNLDDNENNNLL